MKRDKRPIQDPGRAGRLGEGVGIGVAGMFIGALAFLQQGPVGLLLLVAAVCIIILALRSGDIRSAVSEGKQGRGRLLRYIGVVVLLVSSGATYLALWDKGAIGDPFHQVFVDGSVENSLVLTVKRFRAGTEDLIRGSDEPEIHFVVERRFGDSAWLVERLVPVGNNGYTLVRGLPDGTYRVLLRFYEIRLDTASDIQVTKQRGAYVQLSIPPYKGCVTFRVLSHSNGQPLAAAFLNVFAGENLAAIRGSRTDSRGRTDCIWLHSTRIGADAYVLRVAQGDESGELLLSDYPVRPVFTHEWERKTVDVIVPLP